MKSSEMNRRDFTRWTAAAFGGVVAGTLAGCAGEEPTKGPAAPAGGEGTGSGGAPEGSGAGAPEGSGAAHITDGETAHDVAYLMEEPHVCKGLNTCKGKGKGGENACAGQSACATANEHSCHTHNECKGQGGCGDHPGQNACKGQGECAVPLSKPSWETARTAFEKAMKDAGHTEIGSPPDAA